MASATLQGIAKLSGSFAVGGLVARELYTSDSEEDSFSLLSLLLPTKAHSLSLRWRPAIKSPAPRVRPFFALDETGTVTKVYPSEMRLRSISSQFSPSSLTAAIGRGTLFTYLPVINAHYEAIRKDEEEAVAAGKEWDYEDAPEFDYELAQQKLPAAAVAVAKELLVGIMRIVLSWLAVDYLDSRLAWKLVKDQISSIRAKWRFPFYQRPLYISRTMIRSSVIPVCAEFLVSSAITSIRISRETWSSSEKWRILRQTLTSLPVRQLCTTVASAAGAGVAGTIRPGLLCTVAALGAGFAMDVFVCLPAEELYTKKRQITLQTKLIIAGCGMSVAICFLPWMKLPFAQGEYFSRDRLAVSY